MQIGELIWLTTFSIAIGSLRDWHEGSATKNAENMESVGRLSGQTCLPVSAWQPRWTRRRWTRPASCICLCDKSWMVWPEFLKLRASISLCFPQSHNKQRRRWMKSKLAKVFKPTANERCSISPSLFCLIPPTLREPDMRCRLATFGAADVSKFEAQESWCEAKESGSENSHRRSTERGLMWTRNWGGSNKRGVSVSAEPNCSITLQRRGLFWGVSGWLGHCFPSQRRPGRTIVHLCSTVDDRCFPNSHQTSGLVD